MSTVDILSTHFNDEEILNLRKELEMIQSDNSQLEAELARLQDQEANQREMEEAKKRDQAKQLAELEDKILELQKHLKYFQSRGDSLEKQIDVLQAEIGEIEAAGDQACAEIEETKQRMMGLEKEYRELNEIYSDLEGKIRVLCRIRPAPEGLPCAQKLVVQQLDDYRVQARKLSPALTGGKKEEFFQYQFDRVLGPSTTQEQVFEEVITSLTSAMNGKTVCVFAYGQTGSGKTYTMQSVISNSLDRIFDASISTEVRISVVEVYSGKVLDLLRSGKNRELLTRDGQSAFSVPELTVDVVESASAAASVMDQARSRRKTSSTQSNGTSSRSHLIVRLEFPTGGRLVLVDLAGSESADAAVDSSQKQEGNDIRKSLCALKTVLAQLKAGSGGVSGARNSRLTQTMDEFLSPGCKVLMLLHAAPEQDQSRFVLQFGAEVMGTRLNKAKSKR